MALKLLKNIRQNNTRLFLTYVLIINIIFIPPATASDNTAGKIKKSNYIRVAKPVQPQANITPIKTVAKPEVTVKTDKKPSPYISVPWRYDAGLRLAEIQLVNKKYTQAIETLKKVLDRHPANSDAYTYIGYSYMKLDMPKKAKKNLERALKIAPDHMGAHLYMGLIALDNKKPKIALERLMALKVLCKGMMCGEENYLSDQINAYKLTKESKTKDKVQE